MLWPRVATPRRKSGSSSMGSKLTLVLCCAAMSALVTAAGAQRAQQPSQSHATATHQQPARGNDARTSYGQAPFNDVGAPHDHEPGQCYIPVDGDHDLGYWGSCSTKG